MSSDTTTTNREEQPEKSGPSTDVAKRRVRRWEVVQSLVDLFDEPRYVEVGVNKGNTFRHISAAFKVAVDPNFLFDWEGEKRKHGPSTEYHQVTSDVYFGSIVDADQQFDVIYLDGLHTFEQTLRDLTNALAHLAPNGVILIDDVRPPTYHASLPDHSHYLKVRSHVKDPKAAWMGDVYRLIWFIDTFYQSLSYATVSNNHGQAVVWRERRAAVTERSAADVATLPFESVVLSREVLRLKPLGQILQDLRGRVGRSGPHS